MIRLIRSFAGEHEGFTLIEYALIAALVSLASITILSTLGVTLKSFYTTISTNLSSA
jgi:pilus assembly protein Flp/PilA